jgi:radical SAM protein with 4Fe4S-binding SPASM domain
MLNIKNLLCGDVANDDVPAYGDNSATQAVPRPAVVWAVTRACNLKCVLCAASLDGGVSTVAELTREEGFALLDDLKEFGIPSVTLSGGEPLARWDTLALLAHATAIGLNCTLSTNGLLIDDPMADRLVATGVKNVSIGVDGPRELHDKLRVGRCAFDHAIAAIDRCVRRHLDVTLRFTIHALNYKHLDEVFDICLQHGVKRLCISHLAYGDRRSRIQSADLTPTQTRSIMDYIFYRTVTMCSEGQDLEVVTDNNNADAGYLISYLEYADPARAVNVQARLQGAGEGRSGCTVAAIDPLGNVHYDKFSRHYSCGNVRNRPFSKIWSEATDTRLFILRHLGDHLSPKCRQCRFLKVCNGNQRSRAEAATGNWLGFDPSCYLTDLERTGREAHALASTHVKGI